MQNFLAAAKASNRNEKVLLKRRNKLTFQFILLS
jgi:hypothetical protein